MNVQGAGVLPKAAAPTETEGLMKTSGSKVSVRKKAVFKHMTAMNI